MDAVEEREAFIHSVREEARHCRRLARAAWELGEYGKQKHWHHVARRLEAWATRVEHVGHIAYWN